MTVLDVDDLDTLRDRHRELSIATEEAWALETVLRDRLRKLPQRTVADRDAYDVQNARRIAAAATRDELAERRDDYAERIAAVEYSLLPQAERDRLADEADRADDRRFAMQADHAADYADEA